MQRHHVTSSIQLFSRINRFYTISLHHLFRTISIISINIHTDSFCYTSHIASYITVCMNTQLLAHQFRTRFAVVKITNRHNHHTESQLSNCIWVLSRSIHHTNAMCSSSLQIDVIVTSSSTNYDLQFGSGIKHFIINNITTDNNSIGIFYSFKELCFFCIFFK